MTRRLADLLWIWLPRRALRLSSLAGAGLADGSYLRAWPSAAALAPPAALLVGFALGAGHPDELYTYSLLVTGALGMVAALGAGLGCWALVGFAVGDFLLARTADSRLAFSFDLQGVRAGAALLLSYILLAGLLVLIPVVATAVRLALAHRLFAHAFAPLVAGTALVVTEVALAFMWTQSTPFLIRPVWSYFLRAPVAEAIEPLQQRGWVVAVAVGAAAACRLLLENAAATKLDPLEMPGLAGRLRPPSPWWVVVLGRTALVAFLLSGLFTTWLAALASVVALTGIFVLHVRILPSLPGYVAAVTRVALVLRLAVAVLLAYGSGSLIVQRAVDAGSRSFLSLVFATLISLVFIALLVPERPGDGARLPLESP